VSDLSRGYGCGKCGRKFASPDQLKNHEMPCRGKSTAQELPVIPSHRARNEPANHSPIASTGDFERSFQDFKR
jgi:hypothetical protein